MLLFTHHDTTKWSVKEVNAAFPWLPETHKHFVANYTAAYFKDHNYRTDTALLQFIIAALGMIRISRTMPAAQETPRARLRGVRVLPES